jgi:hypothetical protein
METGTVQSDKGIGLAVLFSVLTIVAAVAMFAAPGQFAKAVGFAVAMIAACLAVAATHLYW